MSATRADTWTRADVEAARTRAAPRSIRAADNTDEACSEARADEARMRPNPPTRTHTHPHQLPQLPYPSSLTPVGERSCARVTRTTRTCAGCGARPESVSQFS